MTKATLQSHHQALSDTFKPFIPADGVVLDVGAHAGQFSKLFARLAYEGQVYAVEPSTYARSILERALKWNRIRNVEIVPVALSDEDGVATLRTPLTARGSLGFGRAGFGRPAMDEHHLLQTATQQKLDTFCAQRGLNRLDFIKADVEGWEGHVLRGGDETLRRFRPPLFLEVSETWLARAGDSPSALWAILRPLGYVAHKVDVLDNHASLSPPGAYIGPGDYLFVSRPPERIMAPGHASEHILT